MAIASRLLQALQKLCQACPSWILLRFSQGSISKSLVKKNLYLTNLFNVCGNHVLFILYRSSHFQQTFSFNHSIKVFVIVFGSTNMDSSVINSWIFYPTSNSFLVATLIPNNSLLLRPMPLQRQSQKFALPSFVWHGWSWHISASTQFFTRNFNL